MDTIQKEQEGQYIIPYHYIPDVDADGFSQTVTWSWGLRYLGGIKLILSQLEKNDFGSLIISDNMRHTVSYFIYYNAVSFTGFSKIESITSCARDAFLNQL